MLDPPVKLCCNVLPVQVSQSSRISAQIQDLILACPSQLELRGAEVQGFGKIYSPQAVFEAHYRGLEEQAPALRPAHGPAASHWTMSAFSWGLITDLGQSRLRMHEQVSASMPGSPGRMA